MRSNRFLTPILVVLTLPMAIFICRGRTIEMPRHHASTAALVAAELKKRATLQAQRRDTGIAYRLHKHNGLNARQRA